MPQEPSKFDMANEERGLKSRLLQYLRRCLENWSSNSRREHTQYNTAVTMAASSTMVEKLEGDYPKLSRPIIYSRLEGESPMELKEVPRDEVLRARKDSQSVQLLPSEDATPKSRGDVQEIHLTQNSRIDCDSSPKTKDDSPGLPSEKGNSS